MAGFQGVSRTAASGGAGRTKLSASELGARSYRRAIRGDGMPSC